MSTMTTAEGMVRRSALAFLSAVCRMKVTHIARSAFFSRRARAKARQVS
ncbi:MAG: hypothetical protein QM765_51325 [Myxococcales bacterium]